LPWVEGLHHQVIAVTIHNQRGQQVCFPVHDAVGIGIADHGAADAPRRPRRRVAKEIAADLFDLPATTYAN